MSKRQTKTVKKDAPPVEAAPPAKLPQVGDKVLYGVLPQAGDPADFEHWPAQVTAVGLMAEGKALPAVDLLVAGPGRVSYVSTDVPPGDGFGLWRFPVEANE